MMGALIGTTIGDYTLGSLISTGGMAGVFEAAHTTHGHRVAMKVLRRELATRRDPLARMMQEGRIICSLHNEHIVRVFEDGLRDLRVGRVVVAVGIGNELLQLFPATLKCFTPSPIILGLFAARGRGFVI